MGVSPETSLVRHLFGAISDDPQDDPRSEHIENNHAFLTFSLNDQHFAPDVLQTLPSDGSSKAKLWKNR
eukprot:3004109-Pyramimonas_sp.AAC.1